MGLSTSYLLVFDFRISLSGQVPWSSDPYLALYSLPEVYPGCLRQACPAYSDLAPTSHLLVLSGTLPRHQGSIPDSLSLHISHSIFQKIPPAKPTGSLPLSAWLTSCPRHPPPHHTHLLSPWKGLSIAAPPSTVYFPSAARVSFSNATHH